MIENLEIHGGDMTLVRLRAGDALVRRLKKHSDAGQKVTGSGMDVLESGRGVKCWIDFEEVVK